MNVKLPPEWPFGSMPTHQQQRLLQAAYISSITPAASDHLGPDTLQWLNDASAHSTKLVEPPSSRENEPSGAPHLKPSQSDPM